MSRSTVRFLAGLAVVALPAFAQAQSACVGEGATGCTLSPDVSLTIPKLVRLAIDADSITLTTPNWATDSLNGQLVTTTYAGVSIRANANWVLNVSTPDAAWTYNGTESGARALAALELETTCGSTTWNAISGSAQQVSSGSRTDAGSASICLRTSFPASYDDAANRPGVYQLAIDITLAAP
jgi:hypothetical protein